MKKARFWQEGIRFECQGTGRCCTSRGAYGFVYLTREDRGRLAEFLGVKKSTLTLKYLRRTGGYYHFRDPDKTCQFLEGKACTIYEARPTQCRTWPFWPENMNAKTWNREITTFCPGVGKGRLYSPEEIKRLMAMDPLKED